MSSEKRHSPGTMVMAWRSGSVVSLPTVKAKSSPAASRSSQSPSSRAIRSMTAITASCRERLGMPPQWL